MRAKKSPLPGISASGDVGRSGDHERSNLNARAVRGVAGRGDAVAKNRVLSELADLVAQSSEVREDLVAEFRSRIASGSYQVDLWRLATNPALHKSL